MAAGRQAAMALALLAGTMSAAHADALSACIAQRQQAMSSQLRQSFSIPGRAVCPATPVGAVSEAGNPLTRQDRSIVLTFVAPPGFRIEPGSVIVREEIAPANHGEHGPPQIDDNRVAVELQCRGLAPGEGEASYAATLEGTMTRALTDQMLAEIKADCRGRGTR
jgi:hypothetical protein